MNTHRSRRRLGIAVAAVMTALLGTGLSNQAIAEQLFVSEHTIHRHVANIFSKLSVSSRAAAVAQAARRGLL